MPKTPAKVTTKTGDAAYTGLLGKERVPKYDPRIEALGALDESSSALGLSRALCLHSKVKDIVHALQKDVYVLMAEVATPPENYAKVDFKIKPEDVSRLEKLSDELKVGLDLKNAFIVPGGSPGGAALDLARTVIRRAERHLVRLFHDGAIANAEVIRFINRLSDVVFILARYEEAKA